MGAQPWLLVARLPLVAAPGLTALPTAPTTESTALLTASSARETPDDVPGVLAAGGGLDREGV